MNRSYEEIQISDLSKMLSFAYIDINSFFKRYPEYSKPYKGNEVLVALGQGAALHYIDNANGIKDFDIWFFFPSKQITLPYRRRGVVDFGESKFGKEHDKEVLNGRRIDVFMRSDSHFNSGDPKTCLLNYLKFRKSKTAKMLREKACIGFYPENVLGEVLWHRNM